MSARPQPEVGAQRERVGGVTDLLERNRSWAERKTQSDPHFFERLVGQQSPDYFWIGCSDSRVPATEIVDLEPGEMFVHRNVGNLTPATDINFSAALQFAVEVLRVRDIMVVGHYGCGGIRAAGKPLADDSVGHWLAPVRALACQYHDTLLAVGDEKAREERLCELNVIAQVQELSANALIRQAWRNHHDLTVHGLVYAIGDGLLKAVCNPVSRVDDGSVRGVNEEHKRIRKTQ
jgi:carbonic anhydrase